MAEWTSQRSPAEGSVVVPYEDTAPSVKEIELRAGDPNFAQVLLLSRTAEPLGQRRYWPIYEAAAAAGLPIGVHAFGYRRLADHRRRLGRRSTSRRWSATRRRSRRC